MDASDESSNVRAAAAGARGSTESVPSSAGFGDEEGMNTETFRKAGKEMVDLICQYVQDVDSKQIHPFVKQGFLINQLPADAPAKGEDWSCILDDVENKIMPGITHWTHQQFHAYDPASRSFPSIMADMLSSALGCNGMTWYSSPAYTDLEMVVHDWFAKALGFPPKFMHCTGPRKGGGGFQPSESDAVLVSMMAARYQVLKDDPPVQRPVPGRGKQSTLRPVDEIDVLVDKMRLLTAYCSTEAHACVEKAARLCMVLLRVIDADRSDCLSAERLKRAIDCDVAQGLVPFWVVATIGTYPSAASDNLREVGAVCNRYPTIWLHVDASYGGNALLCPEMRYLSLGIEHAASISVCPEKWALVNFDCTCFWTSDYLKLIEGLIVNPTYLQYEQQNDIIDYRHWGVPLSRRFRALKLWFTLRSYGLHNLQKHIRNNCLLAERFRAIIARDRRLMVMNSAEIRAKCRCRATKSEFSQLGVVCFRVLRTGEAKPLPADQLTELLLAYINQSGRAFMSAVRTGDHFCIRFCVSAEHATHVDVDRTARIVDRCLEKIEHGQYVSMALSMTPASVGFLGASDSGAQLVNKASYLRRRSVDRRTQLVALRYLTNTIAVPLDQLDAPPHLQGGGDPFVVPETDDDIVEHVDLSDLVVSLEL